MTTFTKVITDIDLPEIKLFKKGKVRNVYDLGSELLIVALDRISAFDSILPNGIPCKGEVLTELSLFWFTYLKDVIDNHIISADTKQFPAELQAHAESLSNRSVLVRKTQLIEVECVVRGYLAGSGWKEYQNDGIVCGHKLPSGLKLADPLPEPIFTPAIKFSNGHDENISVKRMEEILGKELTTLLSEKSIELYNRGSAYAATKGIILADTKFEFGQIDNKVILIDEILTPDSSRFWPVSEYRSGISPPSYDKQIVRDYLESTDWDKNPPAPKLPEHIIEKTSQKYKEIKDLLIT
jgi:phosphoribosylaminoimidazole-succinocarboxamide synthase